MSFAPVSFSTIRIETISLEVVIREVLLLYDRSSFQRSPWECISGNVLAVKSNIF